MTNAQVSGADSLTGVELERRKRLSMVLIGAAHCLGCLRAYSEFSVWLEMAFILIHPLTHPSVQPAIHSSLSPFS